MKYSSCVSITMSLISHLLDNNIWTFYNDDNLNRLKIKLENDGFVLEEDSRFGSDPTYEGGYNGVKLSPSYLLKRLFDADDSSKQAITMLIHSLPDRVFQQPLSYIKLVKTIDSMRNSFNNGQIDTVNYYKLKKYLASFSRSNDSTLKNLVLTLRDLDFESIVNIRNIRPDIARKIERMYQIERLLEKYCLLDILEKRNHGFLEVKSLELIDLEQHRTDWNTFCRFVGFYNIEEGEIQTKNWHSIDNAQPRLTVLGLDETVLPGKPCSYQKKI